MTQETEINKTRIAELAEKYPFIPANLLSRIVLELIDDYGYDFAEVERALENDYCGVWLSWEDYVQEEARERMCDLTEREWERVSAYFDYEKFGHDIKHDMISIEGYEGVAILHA